MSKFATIDHSETSFEEQTFHKSQTVTSASEGVHLVYSIKDQTSENIPWIDGGALTVTGSHWAFIHNFFYRSGSTKVSQSNPDEIDKFNSIYHNFNQYNDLKSHFNTKFYDSASVIYIPQKYFGERIKPESFQLVARTGSVTNTTKQIIIKDDGNGNLYSSNAHHSQSANSHLSSSENYVGNIFYDLGVATLTETASWSGSVNYFDIGGNSSSTEKNYNFWDLRFNSTLPMYMSSYTIVVKPSQFNTSMNISARTGSKLRNNLTASNWLPYYNQIQLHRMQGEEPCLIANLPRAIQARDDIDIVISFRMDH
tara:strand:- start:415 stop:1347 length:933 start_codon:yes stop_codon:yes gene_type:complete